MKVIAKPYETTDQLIRRFKLKMEQDDILSELKEKEYYKKPSEIRYRKEIELIKKIKEANKKQHGQQI